MKYALDFFEIFCVILSIAGTTGLVFFVALFWAPQWVRVVTSTIAFVVHVNMILPESYAPTFLGRLKAVLHFFTNPMVLALLAAWVLFLWLYYRWKRSPLANKGG